MDYFAGLDVSMDETHVCVVKHAFRPVKSEDQQATLMAHKTRELLIKQRTMSVNALRGHLAEFGVIAAKGISHVEGLVERAAADLPAMVQATLGVLLAQLRSLDAAIDELERAIVADHRRDPVSRLTAASVPASAYSPLRRFWPARQIRRLQIRPRFRRLAWRRPSRT